MTYNEALEELRNISRKIETEDPGLDEIELLLNRAQELAEICRQALRRVHTRLDEFQNPPNAS